MLKRSACSLLVAILCVILPFVSSRGRAEPPKRPDGNSAAPTPRANSDVSDARFARLRHGINLSHWFAQSPNNDYSKAHLETHTNERDIALIKAMGFDHVRFTVEPAPLFDESNPGELNADYLRLFDNALDMILAQKLAVIVDIHPSDEFKLKLNKDDHHVEALAKFWRALAEHLSRRDPERVFLEVLNEPMVEDGYRWYGIQEKLIAAIRAGAPRHTIIASGHRWSGINELLFLEPYADRNVIYNFHFYEPFVFTHQGATWAGPRLPLYKNVPYPSSVESVSRLLDAITDEQARRDLAYYGEQHWDRARIDKEISAAVAWVEKYHVRLTCNEFGAFRKVSPPHARAAYLLDVRSVLEKYNVGWTMWDYGGGFSVVNKQNGLARPDAETVRALGLRLQSE